MEELSATSPPTTYPPPPKSNFLKAEQIAPSFTHLGHPNAGSIWSLGCQMLMRLSALKQLCAMNGPKKELVRRARDTFPVKKSLWSTATKDNQLFFLLFYRFAETASRRSHDVIFDGF